MNPLGNCLKMYRHFSEDLLKIIFSLNKISYRKLFLDASSLIAIYWEGSQPLHKCYFEGEKTTLKERYPCDQNKIMKD